MPNSGHTDKKASSPSYPDTEYVGDHLVIEKTEYVPGQHPEPYHRQPGQTEYCETFYRCVKCRVECLRREDFPAQCEAAGGDG